MDRLKNYQNQLKGLNPQEILTWAVGTFGDKVALASSFGVEDQLLTHFASKIPNFRIFTLDTGRLFQETYDSMQRSMASYNITYEIYAPDNKELEEMIATKGPNLFYDSLENRKLCCKIRKINPLQRVLSGLDAWVTGLRAGQSATRAEVEPIEWDETNQIYKVNPLFACSEEELWKKVKEEKVVYNRLHDQGFPSIGCAPCTRAVAEGEDIRSGRWWWEAPEHKECGLHNRPVK
ncbi:MAG: phosphoadenylyl-sulfate reductase [SAR324 cluster bacterium]|nr:phosphoadenylyl-sulfate reductase [SAR324 cluster bacterium]